MSLFKYLRPDHADGLVASGSVRIGTLYEYRQSEDERADKFEGSCQYVIPDSRVDTSSNTPEAEYLRRQGFVNCVFENLNPKGGIYMEERLSRDCYIYCTSSKFIESNRDKFGGACIEIIAPDIFFSIVGDALNNLGHIKGKYTLAPITYCERQKVYLITKDSPQRVPGWQIKPDLYSCELEVRVMWEATQETDLKPTIAVSKHQTFRTLSAIFLEVPDLVDSDSFKRLH